MEDVVIVIGELKYTITPNGELHKRRGRGFVKQFPDKDGYMKIVSSQGRKTLNRAVHRLVYEAFVGPIPPGYTVDHIDNDKLNNYYENLQLLSAADNAIKGNARHWKAVSPTGEVVEIYNLRQFCRDHNLHRVHLYSVLNDKPKYKAHKGWRKYNGI